MDAAASSPGTSAKMAGDESLALDAAADQLASLGISEGESEGGKSETSKPAADDLWNLGPPPEDCPVCLVPLPMLNAESAYFPCCGKTICSACNEESIRAHNIINSKRAKKELPPLGGCCAFCRTPFHCDRGDYVSRCFLRTKKDDCMAYFMLGWEYRDGTDVLPKDESKALELYVRAAELGCLKAMALLGSVYEWGTMGVKKDMRKARVYYERAARRGSLAGRVSLGQMEMENDNHDLAIRHWKIAAEGGHPMGMEVVWRNFYGGKFSKAELEEILRKHQHAIDERNSEDRKRLLAYEKAMEDGDDQVLIMLYNQYYQGILKAKELNNALKAHRNLV